MESAVFDLLSMPFWRDLYRQDLVVIAWAYQPYIISAGIVLAIVFSTKAAACRDEKDDRRAKVFHARSTLVFLATTAIYLVITSSFMLLNEDFHRPLGIVFGLVFPVISSGILVFLAWLAVGLAVGALENLFKGAKWLQGLIYQALGK
ncbi:hypothetical protein [Rhodobacter sp. JA431]|uniref:hypothetical protein n=1 Tax=Rhodobacter sp. JA431 TaxID=570013 RepID=UPI00116061DD|nr:hypothetical protein [Rhodobacter sp. JA431]